MYSKKKITIFALVCCFLIASLACVASAFANSINWLAVSYSIKQEQAFVGQSVELPTVSPVYPDRVEKIYFSVISPSGKFVETDGVTFFVDEQGDYNVSICVFGVDKNSYVESYSVTAIKSDKPVLSLNPAVPLAFLEGSEYIVPAVRFTDYNTSNPTDVPYDVYMVDEFGNETLLNQKIIPSVELHGAKIGLKYVATSSATSKTETAEFFVPVLKTFTLDEYNQRVYSYDKLFVTTSIQSSETTPIGATFYGSSDFSMNYANKVDASFSVSFKSELNKINFRSVTVTATDFENPYEKINIEIFNSASTTISINGGVAVPANGGFNDFRKGVSVNFNNQTLVLNDVDGQRLGVIDETVYGAKFSGFSSDFVLLEISVNTVSSSSTLAVQEINGHKFSSGSEQVDYILPFVKPETDFPAKNVLNDVITISKAWSIDVIDPVCKTYITVYDAEGNTATSVDGVDLYEADGTISYDVLLDQVGEYTVQYIAEDISGNRYDYAYYSVFVLDVLGPTISVNPISATVSLGKEVSMPKITVSDNDTDSKDIIVWATINRPDGRCNYIEIGGKFKFDKAGVYFIRYSAIDKNNNITTVEYQVICK